MGYKRQEEEAGLDFERQRTLKENELRTYHQQRDDAQAQISQTQDQAAGAKAVVDQRIDEIKEAIAMKRAVHDGNCQDQRDRSQAQAERIRGLKEIPDMIKAYKSTEDAIVKLDFGKTQASDRIAELRRRHYLETS